MNKATLVINKDEQKRLVFAGMLMGHVGVLPDHIIQKFSRNEFRGEIPDRLLSAFTMQTKQPISQIQAVTVQPPHLFKVEHTNLIQAITDSERFCRKILGVTVELREQFDFPPELPWENVLVIYDPGYNNREAVQKALQSQKKLKVWEETDVMNYDGSVASGKPTLQIIANSITPDADTLGDKAKFPDQLVADGRNYLRLRGYALAFGLRHFLHGDYLDPKTRTWFPKDRLPSGRVAYGGWDPFPDYRKVRFHWSGSGDCSPGHGARLAISCSLKT